MSTSSTLMILIWCVSHREHLYRRHTLPKFKCYRCCQVFLDQSSFSTHLRAEERCEKGEDQIQDGLDDNQIKRLKSRKKTSGTQEMTEHDKWAVMYRIIFPDDVEIPSPCKKKT